jgi:hypothetical protein
MWMTLVAADAGRFGCWALWRLVIIIINMLLPAYQ